MTQPHALNAAVIVVSNGATGYVVGAMQSVGGRMRYDVLAQTANGERMREWLDSFEIAPMADGTFPPFSLGQVTPPPGQTTTISE